MSRDPETILLCALRFWTGAGRGKPSTTPTLRRGVRHVARKQGISPRDLDKAERQLVRGGLATKPRAGTIALTEKGWRESNSHCRRIELPPWDWKATYQDPPGQLDGRKRARKRLGGTKREPPPVTHERKGLPPGVPALPSHLRGARRRRRSKR